MEKPPWSTARRVPAPVRSAGHDNRQLQRLTREVHAVHNRIERRILECRVEAEAQGSLLERAQRLNERLEVLKVKLQRCFEPAAGAPSREQPTVCRNLHRVMQQMAELEPEDAPHEFICPITQCVMIDPVATADNNVYDRPAIQQWFANFPEQRGPTSPLTNLPLHDLSLRSLPELRARIQQFLRVKMGYKAESVASTVAPPACAMSVEASAPIWGSSVVPTSEPQSRTLNMIRLGDLPIPPVTDASAPIWTSSVVPPTEPQSRALNLLRLESEAPLPPPAVVGSTAPRRRVEYARNVPRRGASTAAHHVSGAPSGLYVLPSSPSRPSASRAAARGTVDLNHRQRHSRARR